MVQTTKDYEDGINNGNIFLISHTSMNAVSKRFRTLRLTVSHDDEGGCGDDYIMMAVVVVVVMMTTMMAVVVVVMKMTTTTMMTKTVSAATCLSHWSSNGD
jgi:hypothetical protein